MNIHYPVVERANRSMLGLLAAAVLMASLFLVLRGVDQPVGVRVNLPLVISAGQPIPQVSPVPEPPHNQASSDSLASVSPVPPDAQPSPEPQPVPLPPSGH